ASFNLFQAQLRNQDYKKALVNLQAAIAIDAPRYALHDVDRYPIIKLLGAGGMGCVFLCHDQWRENKLVVKCFWEGREGTREEVFGEAMMMRKIAGEYVPKPLDCGYVVKHERPYFVTEYLEDAIDGEAYLERYGKFDAQKGIAVGLDIAKGLHKAHTQGIYHLDLKPANLLFKQTETDLKVKIIDFGLARAATSLGEEAGTHQSAYTQFGKAIIAGTWDYAPPEQMTIGKTSAKSDLYAFGATLYRLMTAESPRHLNPRRLKQAPPALFDLLCDCKEENPDNRPDIASVIDQLSALLIGKIEKTEKSTKNKIGDIFSEPLKDGSRGPEMVWIPAGTFKMGDIQGTGDDDEKPVHEVSVDRFAMGIYPVTFAEY
ncbi:MAG: protein kinase, partial [Thiomargarita sp.]|nr:protein kinase [Thiomargarita sp.]